MSFHEGIMSGLHAYQGDIFRELVLPANGTAESGIFRSGCADSGIWITAAALTGLVLKEGEILQFELCGADSRRGPFFQREIISSVRGPKQFTAGDEIMRFELRHGTKRYLKLKVSDRSDLSSSVITAYLVRKG